MWIGGEGVRRRRGDEEMIRSGEEERTRSREKEKITGGNGTWEI